MKLFITGASSGIGEALARRYAAAGATLGLFARREAELARVAAALGPATVATYAGDVRDDAALLAAATAFMANFGTPDIVIASAGVSRGTLTTHREDLPAFRAVIETNLLGTIATFQPFVNPMREAKAGALVGIASVGGFRGLPGAGAYCGSKAAVIAYLESLRVELRGSGVSVVTIVPGFIETPLTRGNPYYMPFLTAPDVAARKMVDAIARRRRFAVVPWQMGWVGALLKVAPRPLYDRLFANRGRKPRRVD
ncbi:MAG: SDR family oxidoreductase [Casimicrobiaceae bacterium]